jgi:hypothetical protein
MTTGKGRTTKGPQRAGCDEVKDSLPRSQTEPSGPVRWRVALAGCEPDTYSDRRRARAAAKRARLKGYVVTLTRVETVSRRWRVNGVRCLVLRLPYAGCWSWSAGTVGAWRDTYAEAVEAAERCARGQR